MNPLAWLVLVAVCGSVWGGFVYFLWRGIRCEAAKASSKTTGPNARPADPAERN